MGQENGSARRRWNRCAERGCGDRVIVDDQFSVLSRRSLKINRAGSSMWSAVSTSTPERSDLRNHGPRQVLIKNRNSSAAAPATKNPIPSSGRNLPCAVERADLEPNRPAATSSSLDNPVAAVGLDRAIQLH